MAFDKVNNTNRKNELPNPSDESALNLSSVEQAEIRPLKKIIRSSTFWVLTIIIILVILFGVLTPNNVFFQLNTLFTVGLNASQMLILAVGATILLSSKNMDLSLGTNIILTSTLAAKTLKLIAGTPEQIMAGVYPNLAWAIVAAVAVSIVVGGLLGCINGLIVTKLKIPAFIATLATMSIFWGISLILTQGAAEIGVPRALQSGFGHAKLFNLVPYPLIVALIINLLFWLIMRFTRFGLYACAIGSSPATSKRAGINNDKYVIIIFALVGVLAGIAGFFDLARFATTSPQGHTTDGLMAITAALLGGTSLNGGKSSVGGSMLGAMIPVIIQTGLVIMRIGPFYQLIATGVFLIAAVYLDYKRTLADG